MKTMFVEARKKIDVKLNNVNFDKLPDRIGLLTTVQYVNILGEVKKYLEKTGKKVFLSTGNISKHAGQVLGCDISCAEKLRGKVDAFLFLGSGKFHVLQVALLGKKVFTFDEDNVLREVSKKEISSFKARKKAALLKFLRADRIGIIVSTKPGQENMKDALAVKKKLEKEGKEAFIFVCDNINLVELENFGCDMWLNTACSALMFEPKVLNLCDYRKI